MLGVLHLTFSAPPFRLFHCSTRVHRVLPFAFPPSVPRLLVLLAPEHQALRSAYFLPRQTHHSRAGLSVHDSLYGVISLTARVYHYFFRIVCRYYFAALPQDKRLPNEFKDGTQFTLSLLLDQERVGQF